MHAKINRSLASVALVLGIIIMLFLIVAGVQLYNAADDLSDSLSELGSSSDTLESPVIEEPSYVEDGGFEFDTGMNLDGTPYEQPDDADPGSYTGPLNPDGSPCVGYGCTPEMDAELDAGEAEFNN